MPQGVKLKPSHCNTHAAVFLPLLTQPRLEWWDSQYVTDTDSVLHIAAERSGAVCDRRGRAAVPHGVPQDSLPPAM